MSAVHDPVLLHVGYIKTATTFLQNKVFSNPDAGVELAAGRTTRACLVSEILLASDYVFDAEATRARLEAQAAEMRARGHLPVWSEEMLLGNPPVRRYDGFANARKLHAVYPQAKVLITIRRQDRMALSIWSEYLLGGGTLPLSSVIGTGQEAASYSPVLRPDFLEFDQAIRHYTGLFGQDNLLVLPQEMLAQAPHQYFGALSRFTGCTLTPPADHARAHASEGPVTQSLRRVSNRLIRIDPTRPRLQGVPAFADRVLRRLDRLVPDAPNRALRARVLAQITARYAGCFAQSNQRTARLTGLNLEGLGYEI